MLMRISLGVKEKKSGCQKILPEREREREKLSFLVRHWPLFQTKKVNAYHIYSTLSMVLYYRSKCFLIDLL